VASSWPARADPLLVRDVEGELRPQHSFAPISKPTRSISCAGVETQRQWSDPAIARTTPALLGLFSLITLWAQDLYDQTTSSPRAASWYSKPLPTFSDALAVVRRDLWAHHDFNTSAAKIQTVQIPQAMINALLHAACYAGLTSTMMCKACGQIR
jgi:hypothetical protein